MKSYTNADLEQIVYKQMEILKAMQALLSMLEFQNELIENLNKK